MLITKTAGLRTAVCAVLLAASAVAVCAQNKSIRDHRTKPEDYYLQEGDFASSYMLLPEPPDSTSLTFLNDKARYLWGKSLRDTPRGQQAYEDSNLSGPGVAVAFSEAFGIEIGKETTPEIYKLISEMREDAGDLSTREAKNYYKRKRPFVYFGEPTCNPDHEAGLRNNGSYPSGHTAIGWATALVLSEINPSRQDQILKRGYEMGDSRVICGFHYQSDVDAGRITGAAAVARLHADPAFQKQLAKAKKEMRKLQKQGKVKVGMALPTPVL